MRPRSVLVLGGGVAGLATALLLARDGARVTIAERDGLTAGEPLDAPGWQRRGIPHFLLPHAMIPRARFELIRLLPDVYAALLDAGAHDADLCRKLPGERRPGDEDYQYLAVRRPLLEWGLRRALHAQPEVEVRDAATVTGLRVEGGRVTGAVLDGSVVPADLVVDALGRRTPVPGWLAEAGLDGGATESTDCGVVYYSRYFRQRPGFELPDGPWLLTPRGDLGYLGYATFPGDNRTFSALLAVPPGVPEWRRFKDAPAFDAAVALIPGLRVWVDPAGVEPITGVMPMAGLRNTFRAYDPAGSPGLVPVGDALGHADPVLAHGLAFSLLHADALAAALREHDDADAAAAAYAAATLPLVRERYEFASALDAQRLRMWLGEPVDLAHRDGDYELFTLAAGGAAAMVDPDVFRAYVRRFGLLDSTAVLDGDVAMQRRIEDVFADVRARPRPPVGPPRDEMVAATVG